MANNRLEATLTVNNLKGQPIETKKDREGLIDALNFALQECKTYRNSYMVRCGLGKGRLVIQDEDITDEIVKRERFAKRFLRKLRGGARAAK